ncbi:hypothetical protein [Peribacillus simplex]|uniref:hypothetical protein n=1 Tax=Peribacillus simplex TaxID=1478 RepID=UPI003D2D4B2A
MEVLDPLHVAKQNQLQQIGLQNLETTWLNSDSTPEMKSVLPASKDGFRSEGDYGICLSGKFN